MTFRKSSTQKEIELPTFIDIVFLLLIFFIVSFSPVAPKVGEAELELNLPVAEGAGQVESDELLETILIEILPLKEEEKMIGFRVSVLLPFENYASQRGRLTYRDAKSYAIQYQRQADLPLDVSKLSDREFSRLPAIQLLNDQIDRYVASKFRVPRPSNRIDIRADQEVQFRVINAVMEKCSSYDDLIPSLVFRTKFKRE
ncbi:biopolymer transporter ExbD [candidate division KSB1 bacterium]|nr:biopolymer transporter ExbD [candidate division KSB1 bacterium]